MHLRKVLEGGGRWALEQGDCLELLRELAGESVDAVVTDPPYGISYRSRASKHGTIANDDAPFIWWMRDAWRVLKPGSGLICFCRWDVQEAFKFGLEIAGFRVRSQLVWDRERRGMGDLEGQFAPRHDVAWFATKGRFKFPGFRPPTVFRAARPDHRVATHPTEKPVDLMKSLVEAVTPRNGIVLDPFAGSGATGEAALVTGRRFVGIELEGKYVGQARKRLERASARPL